LIYGNNWFCDPSYMGADPGIYCETTIHEGDSIERTSLEGFHNVAECGPGWIKFNALTSTCLGAAWTSPTPMFAGDTYTQAFPTAGTYDYICELHGLQMKGRVVVQLDVPPVPDTDGPATSGTAAVPNPTDGASTVTLTADVDDTGLGDSNIAAAEYFIDAVEAYGLGTAMSASNGAFNEVSEDVTANVNASGLSLGAHTLYVHGLDTEGNWGPLDSVILTVSETPAGAETVDITILGGTLYVETTAVDFGELTRMGLSQIIDTVADHWHAGDATGTGNGWNLTIGSSEFVSGANTIPVDGTDNFKLLIDHIMIEDGNEHPASQVMSYQPLSATPLKVLSAAVGEGMGEYHFEPELRLNVPAETYAGDYQALLTVTMNAGP
jgi:Copper binding proteins, plastocyanin/azurin family